MPADYDGDGTADIAVFRRTTGTWLVKDQLVAQWGITGDVPVTLDRDGDGRVELGVYRLSSATWYFNNLATHRDERIKQFRVTGEVPIGRGIAQQQRVAARADTDFDSDGRDDVMVYRRSAETWFMRHSDRPSHEEVVWPGGRLYSDPVWPLSGDFNGDGLFDVGELPAGERLLVTRKRVWILLGHAGRPARPRRLRRRRSDGSRGVPAVERHLVHLRGWRVGLRQQLRLR